MSKLLNLGLYQTESICNQQIKGGPKNSSAFEMVKQTNACDQHFLLFQQCFQ